MKRFLSLLAALLMLCGVAAAEGMVAPTELTQAEMDMLDLMGMQWGVHIYDFTAPEDAKTVVLTLWELEDGQWASRTTATISLEDYGMAGRIALQSTDCLGFDLYMCLWTPDGYTSIGSDDEMPEELWVMNMAVEDLWEQANVALEDVQPLLMEFLCDEVEMPETGLHLWAQPEALGVFDGVYAVTVQFIAVTESEYYEMDEDDDWIEWEDMGEGSDGSSW